MREASRGFAERVGPVAGSTNSMFRATMRKRMIPNMYIVRDHECHLSVPTVHVYDLSAQTEAAVLPGSQVENLLQARALAQNAIPAEHNLKILVRALGGGCLGLRE